MESVEPLRKIELPAAVFESKSIALNAMGECWGHLMSILEFSIYAKAFLYIRDRPLVRVSGEVRARRDKNSL